jgi:RNA polymerase sigma factor (sigma-70 family)
VIKVSDCRPSSVAAASGGAVTLTTKPRSVRSNANRRRQEQVTSPNREVLHGRNETSVTGGESTETDAEVIEASLREPERFAVLYGRHHRMIHRYIARRLGRDQADDLMAETFLIAFEHRDRYDLACSNARPWLFGIATNLVGRHHRLERRFWRLIARTGVDPAVESPSERVADRVSAQSMRCELAAAVAGLSRGQRDVLLLTAAGGLSADEIAAALGVAKGTVHSRLNRARKKTRHLLGGTDPRNAREGVNR